jgi:hypothetical protein
MECFIPDPARLLHAIYALFELHYPPLLPWLLEAGRLFHICGLICGKNVVKESSLNIELLKIPVKGGRKMKDNTEGFETGSGGGGFVIVNAVLLGIALSNISDFVADNLSRIITLMFAYKFSSHGTAFSRKRGAGNEDEYLKIIQAL